MRFVATLRITPSDESWENACKVQRKVLSRRCVIDTWHGGLVSELWASQFGAYLPAKLREFISRAIFGLPRSNFTCT